MINWDRTINDFNLSAHLKAREIECRCGCRKVVVVPRMLTAFERTRENVEHPIIISNGVRCPEYQVALYERININRRLHGLAPLPIPKVGYHVLGEGIDTPSLVCPDDPMEEQEFIEQRRDEGWVGIGIQRERKDSDGNVIQVGFTHLDVRRASFALWYYGVGRPNG